ncbi:MAG: hypothetical protein ACI9DC_002891 [Gammaproteobacteria bacterium]|jgi:hypothetical protein
MAIATRPRRFLVELIKPSHYDDDGYVIQWWKAWIPSNSLSSVFGLTQDLAQRKVLGDDIEIETSAYDETNTVIPIAQIAKRICDNDGLGLVCLVGVQSNQYPRALDIARQLRESGVQVAIGGFHVSGCLSMLPELPDDLLEAQRLGITLFAGEAEGRLEGIYSDAINQSLKPLYNYMDDLPGLEDQPTPFLPEQLVKRYAGELACFDAGRGCPFTCSFCTIINVQGRKSRFRDADDVEALIRANAAQGVDRYFITDDNFARNKNWEPIFDRVIELSEREGLNTNFVIQVDALAHKIPNFIEKAARAGCKRVFIGLENINPDSLKSASKGQNRITEYRRMLQDWRAAGVITYAGYILGFPTDTPETIERDIRIIQRELPIDMLEFFCLTPLPGSQDHKTLFEQGVWMDPDMNKYDLEHVVTGHPLMSKEQWQGIYDRAWDIYYSPEHIKTLLKRAVATGIKPARLAGMIFNFYGSFRYERVHPLQSGVFRRKVRTQRRRGMSIVNPLLFYPRRVFDILRTYVPGVLYFVRLTMVRKRIQRDPSLRNYTDIAISPMVDGDDDDFELFGVTDAAKAAVKKAKRHDNAIAVANVKSVKSQTKQPGKQGVGIPVSVTNH